MDKLLKKVNYLLSRKIKEEYVKEPIEEMELEFELSVNYSDAVNAFKNNYVIYRGTNFKLDFFRAEPKLRGSQNTSNVYTRLFSDLLPSWKAWPKRNKSFICTLSKNRARLYGQNVYIVLPLNGTPIGLCGEVDIWNSFDDNKNYKYFSDLSDLNDKLIALMAEALEIVYDDIEMQFVFDDSKDLITLFNKFDKKINKNPKLLKVNNLGNLFNIYKLNDKYNTLHMLNIILDPIRNDFILTDISNIANSASNLNVETWFSDEALFINNKHGNIINKLT